MRWQYQWWVNNVENASIMSWMRRFNWIIWFWWQIIIILLFSVYFAKLPLESVKVNEKHTTKCCFFESIMVRQVWTWISQINSLNFRWSVWIILNQFVFIMKNQLNTSKGINFIWKTAYSKLVRKTFPQQYWIMTVIEKSKKHW